MTRLLFAAILCLVLASATQAEAKKAFNLNPVDCAEGFAISSKHVGAVAPDSWELKISGQTPMLSSQSGKAVVTFILDRKAAKPTGIIVVAPNVVGEKKDTAAQVSSIMAMNAVVGMTSQLAAQQRMDLVAKLVEKASGGNEARLDAGQVAYTLSMAGGTLMFMATPADNVK
ncbi:MAG: hypothetical protein FD177_81 [Desulfovibrionaceae bacterium]|nr:MAG: hypothetical protein FD177_81 [Desulfovibrionaceae bacterium]